MKFYLDISDKVCFALVNENGYIILYQEADFSIKVLDLLYSYLKPLDVHEMTVVTHGVLNDRHLAGAGLIGELELPGGQRLLCQVPASDLEKIAHLAKTAGVQDVFVVDRLGYYTSFKGDKCYVEDDNGLYALFAVKGGKFVSYSRCSSTLEATVQSVCGRAGITECLDAYNLSNFDLLMGAFQNVHCINDPHALYELSLFAYTSSDFAADYRATVGEILDSRDEFKTASVTQPAEGSVEPADVPLDASVEKAGRQAKPAKKLKLPKPASSEIRRQKTTLDKFCIVMAALLLLAAGTAYGINIFTEREGISFEQSYAELSQTYDCAESKLAMYRQYQDYGTLNPAMKMVYDCTFGSAEFDGDILSVAADRSFVEVVFRCRSKSSFEQILSSVSTFDSAYNISEEGSIQPEQGNAQTEEDNTLTEEGSTQTEEGSTQAEENNVLTEADSEINYLETTVEDSEGSEGIDNSISYKEGQAYRLSFSIQ